MRVSLSNNQAVSRQAGGLAVEPPLVLFLDLDGTVVGDVMHIIVEKEIVSHFCPSPAAQKQMKASHVCRMRYGVIRPRLDSFLRRVEQCNKDPLRSRHIELFLYTAGEDSWAAYIVPVIEAALGFTFNRPIFARKNCLPGPDGAYFKQLTPLLPLVVTCLRRKGYSLTVSSLQDRIALVDNNPTVIRTTIDRVRLISCKTYNFVLAFDVLRLVDIDVLQSRYEQIARVLTSHGMYPASGEKDAGVPRSCRHFLRVYYGGLTSRLRRSTRADNGAEIRDRFWVKLRSAMLSPTLVSSLDASHVRAIQRNFCP